MRRSFSCHSVALIASIAIALLPSPARAAPATRPAEPLRVLFVGNSYTNVNDLPGVFKAVAGSAGHPVPLVDSITPGGKALAQHLTDPKTLAKLDDGYGPRHLAWDVIILQEQSQRPAMAEVSQQQREDFLAGAAGLYDRAKRRSPAARVIFYETWARHADAWQGRERNVPLGDDAAAMQARLRKWYRFAAEEHIPQHSAAPRKSDATVAPVGDAWERSYAEPDALRLHAPDNSHPTYAGTYLAALVFRSAIYDAGDAAPRKVSFRGKLTTGEAERLQRVVGETAKAQVAGTTPATRKAAD